MPPLPGSAPGPLSLSLGLASSEPPAPRLQPGSEEGQAKLRAQCLRHSRCPSPRAVPEPGLLEEPTMASAGLGQLPQSIGGNHSASSAFYCSPHPTSVLDARAASGAEGFIDLLVSPWD